MLKRTTSSLIVIMMLCGLFTNVSAQDAPRIIWEYMMLTPDKSNLKKLQDNMHDHNAKYHNQVPYQAYVFTIATGPNIGKIIWQMGPLNFTDLDSRPSDNGHDEDWRDNVLPYIKYTTNGEYWKTDMKISELENMDPNTVTHPLLSVRYMNVNQEQGYLVDDILEKIKATRGEMDDPNPWGVYDNLFQQGEKGRHLATVRFLKNWAELDEDGNFKEAFIKAHGEKEWPKFLDAYEDAFTDSWDEIYQYNAHMSGK